MLNNNKKRIKNKRNGSRWILVLISGKGIYILLET